jgi:hypothetical protein
MMKHTLLSTIGAATIYIYKRIREENKRKKYILLCIKKRNGPTNIHIVL